MMVCPWEATLHAPGFVPPTHIRKHQDYQRLRIDHISMAASPVQHLQMAHERMHVKLHSVISSLTGVSSAWLSCAPFWTANALRQALESWEHYQKQNEGSDRQISRLPCRRSALMIPRRQVLAINPEHR
jgi:hypothetical protein